MGVGMLAFVGMVMIPDGMRVTVPMIVIVGVVVTVVMGVSVAV
jgi:hypothetical protein